MSDSGDWVFAFGVQGFDALGTSTLRDSDLEVSRISCLEL